jgi:2-polyprenyl-3-methyl-5-hydroxy-6-metoxy-1,4-benzoquinol methylase
MTDKPTFRRIHAATDEEVRRFSDLGYEDFRRLANDASLTPNERIGFPDRYRAGFENAILADIVAKLPRLGERGLQVLEIGPGCGPLPRLFFDLCRDAGHRLVWVDAPEMLDQLPDGPHVTKVAGPYPRATASMPLDAVCDVVLAYSVFHHVFAETGGWAFLDAVLSHLAPGGAGLIADIPNVSKRRRFLSSPAGHAFHTAVTGDDNAPDVAFNTLEPGTIDDAVLLGMQMRARAGGFDAYIVPQPPGLPMANRREDLLVTAP